MPITTASTAQMKNIMALVALILLHLASEAQVSVGPSSSTGKGQKPGAKSALRRQAIPVSNFVDYGNLVFLPDQSTSLIGHGFSYDPILGKWAVKQPVAHIQVQPSPSVNPVTSTILFEDYVSAGSSFESNEFEFDLQTTLGLGKIAASLDWASSSGSQFRSNSFGLNWVNYYGVQMANYMDEPVQFFAEAQELIELSETDPGLARSRWIDRFGTFVAVGYESLTSIKLKFSVLQSSSFSNTSLYASLKGQYGTTSGSASFASLVEQALNNSAMTFSLEGVGCNPANIQLPFSPEDIDESSEKNAFLNAIGDLLENAPSSKGLLLIPVSAFPGAVDASPSSLNAFLLGQVAAETTLALKTLTATEDYRRQANLATFIRRQTPVNLTTEHQELAQLATDSDVASVLGDIDPSFGSFLDIGAVKMLATFEDLYTAATQYTANPDEGPDPQDPDLTWADVLQSESNTLRNVRIWTDVLLADIRLYNQSLLDSEPCVRIESINERIADASPDGVSPSLYVLRAENLALFTNPWEDQDNIDFLVSSLIGNYDKNSPNSTGWFNLPIYPEDLQASPALGQMTQFSIDSFTRDSADGLVDLTFRAVIALPYDYTVTRIRLHDQFGRLYFWDYVRGSGGVVGNPPLGGLSSTHCP